MSFMLSRPTTSPPSSHQQFHPPPPTFCLSHPSPTSKATFTHSVTHRWKHTIHEVGKSSRCLTRVASDGPGHMDWALGTRTFLIGVNVN